MKTKKQMKTALMFGVIGLFLACAGQKPFWGDEKTGFILNYRMEKGQEFAYSSSGTQNQSMEMMGQTTEVKSDFSTDYTVKITGLDEQKNILATVTLRSMKFKISSPRGEMKPDLSGVEGKSFGVTLAPGGKALAYSGVDSITIDMGPMSGGKRSVKSYFRNIFPQLPPKPVKIGETWTSKDESNEKQGGLDIHSVSNNTHKVIGYETVDGLECLKIETKGTGSLEGSGEQMGAQMDFEGDLEVNTTWYFAYKKGRFIKSDSNVFMEGTIAVTGGQNMTIPLTQETKVSVKLVSTPQM